MKKRTFAAEQIIRILAEEEKGNNIAVSVYRKYRIEQATYYNSGKREYKDFSIPAAKKLKML